jgi:hypothetical protein
MIAASGHFLICGFEIFFKSFLVIALVLFVFPHVFCLIFCGVLRGMMIATPLSLFAIYCMVAIMALRAHEGIVQMSNTIGHLGSHHVTYLLGHLLYLPAARIQNDATSLQDGTTSNRQLFFDKNS